jgi:hypothetical protein
MDNRRSVDRTRTSKPAAVSFCGQADERSCDVEVRDIGNGGAGIYKSGLALLPTTFELSFDNLRRRCRMVWRRGNFFGVIFEDQSSPEPGELQVRATDVQFDGEVLSLLGDPPLLAQIDNDRAVLEFEFTISERKENDRSDVRFAIGVAVALALPALISLGAYVATTIALRVG